MYTKELALAFVAATTVFAIGNNLQSSDIPTACQSTCATVISLFSQCDQSDENNTSGFQQCMCQGSNAEEEFTSCATCITQNPVSSQNGGTSQSSEVQGWVQYCGNNGGAAASSVVAPVPTPAITPMPSSSAYDAECSTFVITSSYDGSGDSGSGSDGEGNGNGNGNGNGGIYLATSTQCGNQAEATSSYSEDSSDTEASGGSASDSSGTGAGVVSPHRGDGVYYGAAPANALPYYGVAAAFLMVAFAI